LDDCRFDIKVNDCVWYLRAKSVEERQKWIEILEEYKIESGYSSQTSLRRHGSLLSINSAASISVASTGSSKRAHGLKEKLAEMETFKEILSKQVETLQAYFDACANSLTKGFEPYHKELEKKLAESDEDSDDLEEEDDRTITDSMMMKKKASNAVAEKKSGLPRELSKATIEDHAGMAIDFKGEAYTFKATTAGILSNLAHCIELMQQREEFLKKKLDKVSARFFLLNF
jgi:collagen type IV alpha-3-binding protein